MPPALHPRSNFTTSLFGTTLALCFLVVGLPHLIPCPVPHSPQFTEGQMEIIGADGRRYRRRLAPKAQAQDENQHVQEIRQEVTPSALLRTTEAKRVAVDEDEEELRRKGRECPVPKPAGMVGRILGFRQEEERVRPVVRIEDGLRIARREDGKGGG